MSRVGAQGWVAQRQSGRLPSAAVTTGAACAQLFPAAAPYCPAAPAQHRCQRIARSGRPPPQTPPAAEKQQQSVVVRGASAVGRKASYNMGSSAGEKQPPACALATASMQAAIRTAVLATRARQQKQSSYTTHHVVEAEVKQPAQHQVVRPLLLVAAQRKQGAVVASAV